MLPLLATLILFVFSPSLAVANDALEFKLPSAQHYQSAREILELSNANLATQLSGNTQVSSEAKFYIFVSLGLDKQNLTELMEFALKYQADLVLRGLINNNFKQSIAYIQDLKLKQEGSGFIIDPLLFKQYNITAVPSYVLTKDAACLQNTSCKQNFDKITGNISAKFALEKFAAAGDLKKDAKILLDLAHEH